MDPMHVCFKLAYWFQRKKILNIYCLKDFITTIKSEFKTSNDINIIKYIVHSEAPMEGSVKSSVKAEGQDR
jgi:hypothetical protein